MLLKAVLLGAQGVGKSQLLHRMCTGAEFDPFSVPTTDPEFSSFTMTLSTSEEALIQVWDIPGNIGTAANEKRNSNSLLSVLADVHIVILVCDLTSTSSLKYLSTLITLVEAINQPKKTQNTNQLAPPSEESVLSASSPSSPRMVSTPMANVGSTLPPLPQTSAQQSTQHTQRPVIGYMLLINKSEPHLRAEQQVTPASVAAFCQTHQIDRVFETSTALDTNIHAVRAEIAQYGAIISRQRRGLLVDPYLWRRRVSQQLERLDSIKQRQALVQQAQHKVALHREEEERLLQLRLALEEAEKRKPPPPDPHVLALERRDAMWGVDNSVRWVHRMIGSDPDAQTSLDVDSSQALSEGFDLESIARIRRLVASWEGKLARDISKNVPVMSLKRSDNKKDHNDPESDLFSESTKVEVTEKYAIDTHHVNACSVNAVNISRNIVPRTNSHLSLLGFAMLLRRVGVTAWYTGETPIRLYSLFLAMGNSLDKAGKGFGKTSNRQEQVQHLMRVAMAKASLENIGVNNNTSKDVVRHNVYIKSSVDTDCLASDSTDSTAEEVPVEQLVVLSALETTDEEYLLQLQSHALDININIGAMEALLSFPVLMFGLHALIHGSVKQKAEIAWSCIAGQLHKEDNSTNNANSNPNHSYSVMGQKQPAVLPPIQKPKANSTQTKSTNFKTLPTNTNTYASGRPRKPTSCVEPTVSNTPSTNAFQASNTTNIVEIERFLMNIILEGPVSQRILSASGNYNSYRTGMVNQHTTLTKNDLARKLKPAVLKSVDKLMSMLGKRYSYLLSKSDFINGVIAQPEILRLWELHPQCHLKETPDQFFVDCVNQTNLISDVLLYKMCEIGENVTAYKESLAEYKESIADNTEMNEVLFNLDMNDGRDDGFDENILTNQLNSLKISSGTVNNPTTTNN